MDLSELNQQMLHLQNDFQQYKPEKVAQQKQFPKQQEVNFQPITQNINTTQIKRPIKSGEHRNDINEKMNMLNSSYFEPDMLNKTTHFQTTRNNSNYINNINNLQSTQSREPQVEETNQTNNFANYYSHNFDTLQFNNKAQRQYSDLSNFGNLNHEGDFNVNEPLIEKQYKQNIQNQQNNINSHSGGLNMLNVHNLYSINNNSQEPVITNKINDTGYHKIEEKKTDYRQNINNKLDGMIFDNPNALTSMNPILQNSSHNNNNQNNQKDTRMVIQDSNKDYYRQSANDRMSQYSPLSRAANIPIHMANMSVNDFYSNMNTSTMNTSTMNNNNNIDKKIINEEHNKLTSKEMLNNRINNYAPLAKTIQYQTNQTNQTMKPKQWNPSDVNGKLQNVVYNNLPIISNSEIIKN